MTFSKALLSASAVFMGAAGFGATFLPDALLRHVGQPEARILLVLVQTVGALYFGFAVLNWMSRGATVGGIYARPLAIANLLHFMMVAILLLRWAGSGAPPAIGLLAAAFAAFAVAFGALMVRDPSRR